jgi:hypothetical protein
MAVLISEFLIGERSFECHGKLQTEGEITPFGMKDCDIAFLEESSEALCAEGGFALYLTPNVESFVKQADPIEAELVRLKGLTAGLFKLGKQIVGSHRGETGIYHAFGDFEAGALPLETAVKHPA